jgi:sec-independent protein translocase protein TatA
MFENIGLPELIIILFIILLLFGTKRLPEMMRSLGKGVKEFKNGMKEGEDHKDDSQKKDEKK